MNKLKNIVDILFFIVFLMIVFDIFKIIKRTILFNKKESSIKISTKLSGGSISVYIISAYYCIDIIESIFNKTYVSCLKFKLISLVMQNKNLNW